jgi:hypothetical protein
LLSGFNSFLSFSFFEKYIVMHGVRDFYITPYLHTYVACSSVTLLPCSSGCDFVL